MSAPFIGAVAKLAADTNGPMATRALGFLCKALAAANKVKLLFGGHPRTDGKSIWLPKIPYKASAQFVEMVLGNLFHEICHVLHTDFDVFVDRVKTAKNPSLLKGIANAIEDPRIEAKEQKVRPNYVARIFNARQHAQALGFARKPDTEANAMLVYLVLWGHVRNGMIHAKDRLEEADTALRGYIGDDVVTTLAEILEAGFPRLTCTADVFDLCEQILSLLEQAAQQKQSSSDSNEQSEEQDDSQQDGQSQPDDSEKSDEDDEQSDGSGGSDPDEDESEQEDQSQPDDSEKSDEDDEQSQDGGGADSDDEDDASSENGGSDGNDDDSQEQDSSSGSDDADQDASGGSGSGSGDDEGDGQGEGQPTPEAEAVQRLLGEEVENPGAAHADIQKALEEQAEEESLKNGLGVVETDDVLEMKPGPDRGSNPANYDALRQAALAQADAVKRHFLVLMTRAKSRRLEPRSSGRVRPGKFVLASMGAKPFGRRTESLVRETVVELLTDCSSSMAGQPAVLAAQAAVAVTEACTAARIAVGVSAFGTSETAGLFWRVKRFDQVLGDAHGALGVLPALPSGGTPLGEAIERSAMDLLQRPEARKLLLVATDGAPNNPALVKAMVEGLRGTIEVVGVGIGGHSCKGLFDEAISVPRIEELGSALIDYLQKRVIVTRHAA